MLSRAQNLQQVFILNNIYYDKWRISEDALVELHRLEKLAINNQGQEEFTVASLNVRSFMKHFEDVKHLINNDVDVVCLQETWLPLYESITILICITIPINIPVPI